MRASWCRNSLGKASVVMAEFSPSLAFTTVVILAICLLVCTTSEDVKNYEGYKTFRVTPENELQVELLRQIQKDHNWVVFWDEPSRPDVSVTVMVSPQEQSTLLHILRNYNVDYQLRIDNVQHLIENTRKRDESKLRKRGEFNFEHYETYDEVLEFMDNLATLYDSEDPDELHISSIPIAESFEGRKINVLKLGAGSSLHKPVIWMMGGIHAREWIGPATLMYIAKKLAHNWQSDSDPDVVRILDKFDWYILPVFNVDGYIYTWTSDRLWRKTRSVSKRSTKHSSEKTRNCMGVDPNRNWDFHWNGPGSTSNNCAENYAGSQAFSETEVRQIADFLAKLNTQNPIVAFLDFHSYGQMWMSPYGFSDSKPEDYEAHVRLANQATNALSDVQGTQYQTGNIAEVIYEASGNSVDWAYGVLNVKFSYAVELPDNGTEGFLLSPEHITSVGQETFEAVKEMAIALLDSEEIQEDFH